MLEKNDYIFGVRAVIEAIESGKDIDKILIKSGPKNDLINELFNLVKKYDLPYSSVPIEKINRITQKNHQGVVAFISPIVFENIEEIIPRIFEEGKLPLILILDKITDVRNFGAIARTAECANVNAIIIPAKGAAQINGDAVKTSAGALHHIPICRNMNLKKTIDFLKKSGLQILAATEKADQTYFEVDMTVPTAIIMGAEDEGISYEYLKLSDKKIKIPILEKIESLNVSVAAAVLVYEAVRQRMAKP